MNRFGKVVSIQDGLANLEVKKQSACGTGCGACAANCNQNPIRLTVLNTLNAKVGDMVEISTDDNGVLKYTALLYGLPLLLLFVGFLASYLFLSWRNIENNEVISSVIGFLSMILAGIIIRNIDKKSTTKSQNINHMIRKL